MATLESQAVKTVRDTDSFAVLKLIVNDERRTKLLDQFKGDVEIWDNARTALEEEKKRVGTEEVNRLKEEAARKLLEATNIVEQAKRDSEKVLSDAGREAARIKGEAEEFAKASRIEISKLRNEQTQLNNELSNLINENKAKQEQLKIKEDEATAVLEKYKAWEEKMESMRV